MRKTWSQQKLFLYPGKEVFSGLLTELRKEYIPCLKEHEVKH